MSIPDKITDDFLNSLINKNVRAWTGGHLNSQGKWAWTDGSEWKYTNWVQGAPDNWKGQDPDGEDVLEILENGRGWNDNSGKSNQWGSLCHYNPGK